MAKFTLPRASIPSAGAELVPQAITGAGEAIAGLGIAMFNVQQKRQRLKDTQAAMAADSYMKAGSSNSVAFRNVTADTNLWQPNFEDEYTTAKKQITGLEMSKERRALVNTQLEAWRREGTAGILALATKRDVIDTQQGAYDKVVTAWETGDIIDKALATRFYAEAFTGTVDKAEFDRIYQEAQQKGEKQKATEARHQQQEKRRVTSERQEASLLQVVRLIYKPGASATDIERIIDAGMIPDRQGITGLSIQGVKTTRALLEKRLQWRTPSGWMKESDVFANQEAMRLNLRVGQGAITRKKALSGLVPLLSQLNETDGKLRLADFEKAFTRSQSTALDNAIYAGRSLMSVQFTDIDSAEALRIAIGLMKVDPEEKKRMNRRFMAEMNNRNLYNESMNDYIRNKPDATATDIRNESIRRIGEYQAIVRGTLEQVEAEVAEKQKVLLSDQIQKNNQQLRAIDEEVKRRLQKQEGAE